jgi:hypothetical protein
LKWFDPVQKPPGFWKPWWMSKAFFWNEIPVSELYYQDCWNSFQMILQNIPPINRKNQDNPDDNYFPGFDGQFFISISPTAHRGKSIHPGDDGFTFF